MCFDYRKAVRNGSSDVFESAHYELTTTFTDNSIVTTRRLGSALELLLSRSSKVFRQGNEGECKVVYSSQ